MITSKDLEKVCNYIESTKPSLPQAVMTFMDWTEEPNEEYLRELKRKNRELTIDAIIDGKIEEFKNRDTFVNPIDNQGYMSVISPKINSINVQGKLYQDITNIFTDVMQTLDSITSNQMNIPQNLNVKIQTDHKLTDSENEMSFSRKVISRISMVNNLIAATGRTGPANTIISGLGAYMYILLSNGLMVTKSDGIVTGNLMGMNVIPSPLIKSNKIIMMRNVQKTENGLNVINFPNEMKYFLKETPNFDKVINWFEVI